MIFELKLGQQRLVVDTNKLTVRKVGLLADGILEVKKQYLLISKYPLNEGEDLEAWSERVSELITSDERKKDDESISDFVSRRHRPDMERVSVYKDAVKLIAKVLDQETKTHDAEAFEEVSYPEMKNFVKRILGECDINENYLD